MVVMLSLGETRAGDFFAASQLESGQIAAVTLESTSDFYGASEYDASGYAVAPKTTPFNRKSITEGFQDHHIISDKNALTKNHELLDLAGFNLQSRSNKMFLPTDGALHPTRSIHLGRHRTSVSRNLAEQMDSVVNFGKQNGFSQGQFD